MDKKQSALIRIIAWSVVAVVLVGVLVLGLTGNLGSGIGGFSLFGINLGSHYADAGKYQAGSGEIPAQKIQDLEINWLDGNVEIEVYDGDTVQFSETSSRKLSEKNQMHYYNKNGKLIIQYQKSFTGLFNFINTGRDKELTVKIPESIAGDFGEVRVDTVSADTVVSGISGGKFRFDSTSGGIHLEECSASELVTDTTSGSVTADGSYGEVEFDTVSGNLNLSSEICPSRINADGVSGSVTLYLPENEGFTYKSDSVSGTLTCEFQVSQGEDKGTYKNGKAKFSFDSVSGDVEIKKLSE